MLILLPPPPLSWPVTFSNCFSFPGYVRLKCCLPRKGTFWCRQHSHSPGFSPVHASGSGCRIRLPDGPQESLRKVLSHLTTLPLAAKEKDNFCFQLHLQWSRIVHPGSENQCIFKLLVVYTLSFRVLVYVLFWSCFKRRS